MSSISPVPKTPWPVSKVQNWLLLLVGVKGPAGPLNSSLHTSVQFWAFALPARTSSAATAKRNVRPVVLKIDIRVERCDPSIELKFPDCGDRDRFLIVDSPSKTPTRSFSTFRT